MKANQRLFIYDRTHHICQYVFVVVFSGNYTHSVLESLTILPCSVSTVGGSVVNSLRLGVERIFPVLTLLVFWMALTVSVFYLNIFLGLICSILTAFIAVRMLTQNLYRAVTLSVLGRLPVFTMVMMWNIIRANIEVALIVLNPRLPINPRIFNFKTRLEGDFSKVVLANCITLTPGTVTVDIQDDMLYVHGLTAHNEESLIGGELERIVAWLFGQKL